MNIDDMLSREQTGACPDHLGCPSTRMLHHIMVHAACDVPLGLALHFSRSALRFSMSVTPFPTPCPYTVTYSSKRLE